MKKLIVTLMLLPFIGISQNTNFTGKWSLDKKKIDFKNVPEWVVPASFDIRQKKNALAIQAKMYDKDLNQHYYDESLPFDGKTNEILLYNENRRDVSMRWNANDSSSILFTIRIIRPDNPAGITYSETWSLEDGGKTLVVDRVAPLAHQYSIKAYYSKK